MSTLQDAISLAEPARISGIKLSVPELFSRSDFMSYIATNPVIVTRKEVQSWAVEDYIDVMVSVDPSLSGEGSDSGMPGWDQIVDQVRSVFGLGPFGGNHFVVVLCNY